MLFHHRNNARSKHKAVNRLCGWVPLGAFPLFVSSAVCLLQPLLNANRTRSVGASSDHVFDRYGS